MKAYKAVNNYNSNWRSYAVGCVVPRTCAVEYKVGKWAEPTIKGTYLFVFETLKDALDFDQFCPIFECEVPFLIDPPKYIANNDSAYQEYVDNFLKFRKKKQKISLYDFGSKLTPKGTKLTTKVKLIKRVR